MGEGGEPIPDRSIYFVNNLIYNPAGVQSQWQQFAIFGPQMPSPDSNIPSPAVTDDNLRIQGNVLWNDQADHSLGIGEGSGCQPPNPTCNAEQLVADNYINTLEPRLVDPEHGDFHPWAGQLCRYRLTRKTVSTRVSEDSCGWALSAIWPDGHSTPKIGATTPDHLCSAQWITPWSKKPPETGAE